MDTVNPSNCLNVLNLAKFSLDSQILSLLLIFSTTCLSVVHVIFMSSTPEMQSLRSQKSTANVAFPYFQCCLLLIFWRATLKNMGKPGYEAMRLGFMYRTVYVCEHHCVILL